MRILSYCCDPLDSNEHTLCCNVGIFVAAFGFSCAARTLDSRTWKNRAQKTIALVNFRMHVIINILLLAPLHPSRGTALHMWPFLATGRVRKSNTDAHDLLQPMCFVRYSLEAEEKLLAVTGGGAKENARPWVVMVGGKRRIPPRPFFSWQLKWVGVRVEDKEMARDGESHLRLTCIWWPLPFRSRDPLFIFRALASIVHLALLLILLISSFPKTQHLYTFSTLCLLSVLSLFQCRVFAPLKSMSTSKDWATVSPLSWSPIPRSLARVHTIV